MATSTTKASELSPFIRDIIEHVRAGYQCLLIPTTEEARCENELKEAAREMEMGCVSWEEILGFSGIEPALVNPVEALGKIGEETYLNERHSLVIFKDLHNHYGNPAVRRTLRSMTERVVLNNSQRRRPLILLQPSTVIHPDIVPCVTVIDFERPSALQLDKTFEQVRTSIRDATKRACTDELRYRIVQGLRGLTSTEAANCLALCLIRHKGFVPELVETVESTKANIIKKSEILRYVPRSQLMDTELGGYDELDNWIDKRSLAYTPGAAEIHLDMPKGIILAGVPGTGKSRACERVAKRLGLPLVFFDFSAVFNSLVGESERRTREVISTVAAIGGCVLVIDEADKALGGSVDSTGDSGVTRRVFGQLLTWLANKNDRTFVVMTLNRTAGMPPELLRKGRFDELFYVDIPEDTERKVIFDIHLQKRGIDPTTYNTTEWKAFLHHSKEFVGSEIEEAIKSARFDAFSADQASRGVPTASQLQAAIEEVGQTRVVKIDQENIKAIREFGAQKARPVSTSRKAGRGGRSRNLDLNADFDTRN